METLTTQQHIDALRILIEEKEDELYWHYDDIVQPETTKLLLEENGLEKFEDAMWEMCADHHHETEWDVKDNIIKEYCEEHSLDPGDFIEALEDSHPSVDINITDGIRHSDDLVVRVILNSNYDCGHSQDIDFAYNRESYLGDMLRVLNCNPKDINPKWPTRNYKNINPNPQNIEAELQEVCYGYNLTFLFKINVSYLYEEMRKGNTIKGFHIGSYDTGYLHNDWLGSPTPGSINIVDSMDIILDSKIPYVPDAEWTMVNDDSGYGIVDTCGLTKSCIDEADIIFKKTTNINS